jgi:XTP/dITP diphosphohydrolase
VANHSTNVDRMKELIFATHNAGKADEIRFMLGDSFLLHTLKSLNIHLQVAETGTSLHENAAIKSNAIFKHQAMACFADDTGLFVDALQGAPGIYAARYAGSLATDNDNINLLIKNLHGVSNRKAYFKTVICFTDNKGNHFFDGEMHGHISKEPIGENGFGYDPIFVPDGLNQTLAQLSAHQKNAISHRAKAFAKLINFLTQEYR